MQRRAFTLIELLVVVAIIGLLSTIAIVGYGASREKARLAAGQSFEQSIQQALGDKIEGEWKFESVTGGTTPDTSGNGRTGTVTNGTLVAGVSGNALSFSGTGYVDVGTISIPTDVTVSAWIYPTLANQGGFIVGKNPVNNQWEVFLEGGQIKWRGGASVSNSVACPEPSINAWHHIAATQSGTDVSIYVDGRRCISTVETAINNGTGTVQIGTFGPGNYNFNGIIDEVRVYSGSLLNI